MKSLDSHCFMLESVEDSKQWGRYTFLGYDPINEITCRDGVLISNGQRQNTVSPSTYLKSFYELAEIPLHRLSGGDYSGKLKSEFAALFDEKEYCEMVKKAKDHIYEGDIFQVVLPNRLEAEFEGSLLNTYRTLRMTNPSPYMFYFASDTMEMAGASPETLVKLQDGILHTFPLAGTRKGAPRRKKIWHLKRSFWRQGMA